MRKIETWNVTIQFKGRACKEDSRLTSWRFLRVGIGQSRISEVTGVWSCCHSALGRKQRRPCRSNQPSGSLLGEFFFQQRGCSVSWDHCLPTYALKSFMQLILTVSLLSWYLRLSWRPIPAVISHTSCMKLGSQQSSYLLFRAFFCALQLPLHHVALSLSSLLPPSPHHAQRLYILKTPVQVWYTGRVVT